MGYPGWHLECSVMSTKYLGKTIDIHGGGLENQFPHHECEIAQAEAANGVQFVRYWVHNNMVTVDGQKMGKSLDNFITLKEAFSGSHERLMRAYDPLAVRQLILNSHYRSPLDFSDAALYAAQSGYMKITETVKEVRKRLPRAPEGEADKEVLEQTSQLREKFEGAMNDDLNTSVALSALFEMVRLAKQLLENGKATAQTLTAIDDWFRAMGGDVLGVVKDEYVESGGADEEVIDGLVNVLIEQRNEARSRKDFAAADAIRDKLSGLGIVLEDSSDGTDWRRK